MDQDDLERVGVIKYEEFFRDFLEANKLCVFSSEVTQHWRSRKEWVKDGRPNFEFLSNHFGNFSFFVYRIRICWVCSPSPYA